MSLSPKKAAGSPKLSRLPRYSSSPDLNGELGRTSPSLIKKNLNNKLIQKKESDLNNKKFRRYSHIELDNKKIDSIELDKKKLGHSKPGNQSKLPHFSWNKYASDGRQSPHPQRAFLASDGRSSPRPDIKRPIGETRND